MNVVVLVKQVPDISDIRPDAWDTEKGTLRRGVLDSVLNPMDLHALTLAAKIRRPGSKIVALTMGPPQAEEMLRDCLARCVDEAVLLSDVTFAGADTCATAMALAYGIRRVAQEFGFGSEYAILAGMQSVDGDTAQVPPQVAEELGIEQIAYVEDVTWRPNGELAARRIGPRGMEEASPKEYPVLITATSGVPPIYRSFHRAREALRKNITRWKAADLGLKPAQVGLKGSRTQVVRIFSPSEAREGECKLVEPDRVEDLLEELRTAWNNGGLRKKTASGPKYQLGDKKPDYKGEVWVFAEHEEGKLHNVSLELLGKARELADSLGERVGAVLAGHKVEGMAQELIAHGADRVYVIEHPLLEEFLPIPAKKVLVEAVRRHKPQIFLFGATPLGRELAPRVAYGARSGLTADCTQLEISDVKRDKRTLAGVLRQTRPALGGNIMATIITKNSPVQMATVRPAVMQALPANPDCSGEVIKVDVELDESCVKTCILSRQSLPSSADLAKASVIVAGGRGLGNKETFDRVIRPLAEAFGRFFEAPAEVGASRAAVEEGFISREHQVGQTGQTVQPRLYVAVGISGAIQHISGMQNSGIIVAINKDPRAGIFQHADFGIVGEYEAVAPRLLAALEKKSTAVVS